MRSARAVVAPSVRLALGAALLAVATHAAAAEIGDPRLNGFWNIVEEARGKALAGAKAEMTPAGAAIAKRNAEAQAARTARGEVVGLASYTCGRLGVPFIINTSEPWLLVVTPDEVLQVAERRQITPRRFYTDGRSWPDLSKMPPSTSGYSIAHWEGKDLVIETRGLPPGGTNGGGVRGTKAVLHERVSVSPDGTKLTWNWRWEDPEMLAKPLAYAIEYERAPKHTYALTYNCDPNEDAARLVAEPPQN